MKPIHTPVLLEEAIQYLNLGPEATFIDATLDGGGHTLEILKRFPGIKVLGIEWDPVEFKEFMVKINDQSYEQLTTVNDSYVRIAEIAKTHDVSPDAVLFDLGVSSWHYEHSDRGFSFQRDEVLDMRFNPQVQTRTAAEVMNTSDATALEHILALYGQEQFAKEIAHGIVQVRSEQPILTTLQLVKIIEDAVPAWYRRKKIHCATKTFQAFRIAVNDEIGSIRAGVSAAIDILNPGGRLAVISFHGIEDKTVREVFRARATEKSI